MSSSKTLPAHCDLLVVGSGAGGFAAAISAAMHGCSPVIIEKAPWFGGSTAVSGGAIWCPANHLMLEAGMKDDLDQARRYLRAEMGENYDADIVDSFLENGPDAIRFFHERTELKMAARTYAPDYHPELDGAALRGRAMDALEYDGRKLGKELARLRPPIREFTILGGMQLGRMDIYHFARMARKVRSFGWATKAVLGYGMQRLRHGRNTHIKLGAALAARLAETAFNLGIPVLTQHELVSIDRDDSGRITAATVGTPEGQKRITTSRGIVLAGGGYPQDPVKRAETFPHVKQGLPHYSMAPASTTGRPIKAAEAIGARFVLTNTNAASWAPISLIPQKDGSTRPFPHLFMDRAKPGIIAVGYDGRRFANEALSYHDFVQAMIQKLLSDKRQSAWLVCDHASLRRYGMGVAPFLPGRISPFLRSGYLKTGANAAELAAATGVDAGQLENTLKVYNEAAARGEDPAFGKGCTEYQTALGDPEWAPNPCVKPLKGRLYAIEIYPGDIGTTMGLDTNGYGEVRDTEGEVIPGLYAVGNDANSMMRGTYPGAGITLGPALVFGYVIGRRVAGVI